MNHLWMRISGIALLAGAVIGILLSIAGLVLTWVEAPRFQAKIGGLLDQGGQTLTTTQTGLGVLSSSLDQSQQAIRSMQTTADDVASSIDQTVPMVHSTAGLVGTNVSGIIDKTQASLASAKASARLIDDTLGLIASLPLIGQRYAPSQSLSDSIDQVSKSLAGLPDSLATLQGNLNTSADNLTTIREQVQALSGEIHQMDSSIGEAKSVVSDYQSQVTSLQGSLAQVRKDLPAAIAVVKWGASLFFVWLAIAQVGLAFQGIDLVQGRRELAGYGFKPGARGQRRTDGRPVWSAASPAPRPVRRPVRHQTGKD